MDAQTFYKQTGTAIAAYLLQELGIRPGVHWKIRGATSGPRVLTLNLLLNPRYAKKIASMGEALSMAAGLDKDASIRVSRGNRGALCLEIPKPQALWYNVSVNSLPRRRGLLAPVGIDGEHRPTGIDFSNPLMPHLLIAGQTGTGKSNCLKLLAYDLASQNQPGDVGLLLLDVRKKGRAWREFASIPHLLNPVVKTEPEAQKVLSWAVAEIDRRSEQDRTMPHIFIAIDESQSLLEGEGKDGFALLLKDLTTTGREYGIHTIMGLSNPTAAVMGGTADLKRNIGVRLVGRCDSATAAVVATGQADSGAELLIGAGDMLLVQPTGIKRLTAALLTEKDTAKLPRAENIPNLDLGQYEDVNHVIEQADNKSKADPLDPKHVAVALVAERGITWLAQRFSIGSAKARRVLEFANDLRDELIEMGCYTTIPPYQQGIGEASGEGKEGVSGMVVCQYGEE